VQGVSTDEIDKESTRKVNIKSESLLLPLLARRFPRLSLELAVEILPLVF